ncbi:hypothetical protein [Sinisalibacter aestuarii]|uniref:Uncharacterized protein n=1 Tax=Sinisalibacter aestuarii TaxID=2949426 RepID=A0ABQ5LZI3_9RHOB|nr:hypothetical protein [Sinisalibacter aestuarii]GKY89557.1 hypothetical protein STA1M1_34260 [Sinisalibacter aestuarii]
MHAQLPHQVGAAFAAAFDGWVDTLSDVAGKLPLVGDMAQDAIAAAADVLAIDVIIPTDVFDFV